MLELGEGEISAEEKLLISRVENPPLHSLPNSISDAPWSCWM